MSDKIYEYNGKHYCETDISLTDDKYGGDLFDLYWDASHGDLRGVLCDATLYYSVDNPEITYDSCEELVEDYFEDCVIGEAGEQNEQTKKPDIEKQNRRIVRTRKQL